MPYCSAADVRLLSGITSDVISDIDLEGFIEFSDQQINDDLGSFSAPFPTRIKDLSALLTAIRLFNRPDLRFRVSQTGLTEQDIEKALERWRREVNRIYAYYGKVVSEAPDSLKMV